MSRVYWDTMLFVYWLEDHPRYAKRVQRILSKIQERQDLLCTSAFTLGEILVGPHKLQADSIALQIIDIFKPPFVDVIPYTVETAKFYARIRALHAVTPPDAIHLACAAQSRTDIFLTNDSALVGKIVPGIQFIAGIDSNLF